MEENTQRFGEISLEPETEAEEQKIKDNLWPTYYMIKQTYHFMKRAESKSLQKDVASVAYPNSHKNY